MPHLSRIPICLVYSPARVWPASIWPASLWSASAARLCTERPDHRGGDPASADSGADVPRITSAHSLPPLPGGDCHCDAVRDWHLHLDRLSDPLPCWVSVMEKGVPLSDPLPCWVSVMEKGVPLSNPVPCWVGVMEKGVPLSDPVPCWVGVMEKGVPLSDPVPCWVGVMEKRVPWFCLWVVQVVL